jgi:histidinol dehydrogenase
VALADAVDAELEARVPRQHHADRIRTALSGPQSGTILVDDVASGVAVVNAYAAEHLEIQTADASTVAARVRNAGAVFIGPNAPVPLGDYLAGSNHVLPTGGCAHFASGLNVLSYLKSVQVIDYTADALRAVVAPLAALADAEDLPAHGEAVRARFA